MGRTRGRIPTGPMAPPPPLPPAPTAPRAQVGSTGMALDEVLRDMVVAYKEFVGGDARVGVLLRRIDGEWKHVRLLASDLMDEGLSGSAFVRHVCEGVRAKRGRDPWPSEVFSQKGFPAWLASYKTSGEAGLSVPGYSASPERAAAHRARVEACRATS